jgi:hypothetical protein
MGREILAEVTFRGTTAATKVLLESDALILRGGHKARFARSSLDQVKESPEGLHVVADDEAVIVTMPQAEAARWVAAIRKPPPSLRDKLGIAADRTVHVIGPLTDSVLQAAVTGSTTSDPAAAALLLTELTDLAGLDPAARAATGTGLAVWCVYPKGAGAVPAAAEVREAMRAAGLIDTKTCAVSDRLTATRYSPQQASR